MDKSTQNILVFGVILYLVFGNGFGGESQTTPDEDNNLPASCAYEPTFELVAQDKWDSTVAISTSHKMKVNGGATETYDGNADAAKLGDKVQVLWGAGNATIYDKIGDYEVSTCGLNQFKEMELVQNTTVTIDCKDENGLVIDGNLYNYTIGSGEVATIECRVKLDASKKGVPHGAVLVAELYNGTTFIEEDTAITGGPIGAKLASVPGAYTPAGASNKELAYEVSPLMTTGYQVFNVYIAAESGVNPADTNDLVLTMYSKDCFENSDTGAFECGVETEDSAWAGKQIGTFQVDID